MEGSENTMPYLPSPPLRAMDYYLRAVPNILLVRGTTRRGASYMKHRWCAGVQTAITYTPVFEPLPPLAVSGIAPHRTSTPLHVRGTTRLAVGAFCGSCPHEWLTLHTTNHYYATCAFPASLLIW